MRIAKITRILAMIGILLMFCGCQSTHLSDDTKPEDTKEPYTTEGTKPSVPAAVDETTIPEEETSISVQAGRPENRPTVPTQPQPEQTVPAPTKPPETKPEQTTPPPESPLETLPERTEPSSSGETVPQEPTESSQAAEPVWLTYEEFMSMTGQEQMEYWYSFQDPMDYIHWYQTVIGGHDQENQPDEGEGNEGYITQPTED